MEPEFWLERWQRGEIGWHQDEINRHLREFWPHLAVPVGARVLVPLCGKSVDLMWLAGAGHQVLGVELSRMAADAVFDEQGLTPTITQDPPFVRLQVDEIEILVGDFFDLTQAHLGRIDAVYDRAALIALPPPSRPRYAAHLDTLLGVAVPRLLITLEYDQALMAGPPFSVQPDEVQALFAANHQIEPLAVLDVLDESPRFRARGLDRLAERVFKLTPRAT